MRFVLKVFWEGYIWAEGTLSAQQFSIFAQRFGVPSCLTLSAAWVKGMKNKVKQEVTLYSSD
jgi:hypothetical protein